MTSIDTSRDVPGTDLAPRTSALALVVICTGHFLVILDAMVVNVALPSIGHDLHGGVTGLQWDVDAYTLSFAGLLLTAGTMAERLGARPVFLGGVAAFTLASAACGLAPSLGVLVAARAVQGIGAAALVPSSLVLLRPPTRPGPGGHAPWGSGARSAGSARRPADHRRRARQRLELARGVLHQPPVALAALMQAGRAGWASPVVVAGFVLALAAMAVFIFTEHRSPDPMLPLGLFARPSFRSGPSSAC